MDWVNLKLVCKKSEKLSVDTHIFKDELYNLTTYDGWKCPWIKGLGINGYSYLEVDPDKDREFCNIWNFFYKPEEWREIQIKKIL